MIDTGELERYLQQRTEQDTFSGVALITQGSLQLFAGAYGYASRSWKVPNTLTMRFDSASVTKLFTAVATLQLIDQGFLAPPIGSPDGGAHVTAGDLDRFLRK